MAGTFSQSGRAPKRCDRRATTKSVLVSIALTAGFFEYEFGKRIAVSSQSARAQKPGELVRVHFNLPNGTPGAAAIRALLRMEREPFIVGVGQVRVEDAPEGIVIAGRDEWEVDRLHGRSLMPSFLKTNMDQRGSYGESSARVS